MTPVASRLIRLLNMVPYFQAHPWVTYDKAAADLGVTRKQLEADIRQLWMCGLPGYGPGELIDFAMTDDSVTVTYSAGVDQPLRLNSTEASGLLVALRALVDIPGAMDPGAALSAIAKIEAAAGGTGTPGRAAADPARTDDSGQVETATAATARAALRDARALAIEYYSASRDTLSARVVDPIRVVVVGGHSYLEAWCREADAVRLFRFDRIVAADVLDEPSVPPKPAAVAPPHTALFDADPSLPVATLRVSPQAAWMLEYFPVRDITELPDGHREVALTYAAEEWLARQLLGFGADVAVLAPQSLVERVRLAATEALAAYSALDGATLDS